MSYLPFALITAGVFILGYAMCSLRHSYEFKDRNRPMLRAKDADVLFTALSVWVDNYNQETSSMYDRVLYEACTWVGTDWLKPHPKPRRRFW